MMRHRGTKVLTTRRGLRKRNRGNKLPQRGEKFFYVALRNVWLFFRWRAHRGYIMCALCSANGPEHEVIERWSFGDERMPIKKRTPSGELPAIPALVVDTVLFKRCPVLMEWVTATAYTDGEPRTPGYFQLRNRVIEFELTVYDPDAGMRVAVRAREIDKAFAGMEALLMAPEAPWEVDRYLSGLLPKKKKKKS